MYASKIKNQDFYYRINAPFDVKTIAGLLSLFPTSSLPAVIKKP